MSQWQPIDTAPRESDMPFLVVGVRGEMAVVETSEFHPKDFIISGHFWVGSGDYGELARPDFEATHWMALPERPK